MLIGWCFHFIQTHNPAFFNYIAIGELNTLFRPFHHHIDGMKSVNIIEVGQLHILLHAKGLLQEYGEIFR